MKSQDVTGYVRGVFMAADSKPEVTIYKRVGKRCVDLILCALLLPIVLPILLGIWLVARRTKGQRLIFAQKRVGFGGKTFWCYKVQTMVPNAGDVLEELCASDPAVKAEWDEFQKLKNDPRITPIGKILRKTSLDELPQIFNVLKGEMSFVGPRPFMVEQDKMYREAGGKAYYDLLPGISGEWQVNGRGTTSFASRVSYDTLYAKKLSLTNDLILMVKTFSVVLRSSGT